MSRRLPSSSTAEAGRRSRRRRSGGGSSVPNSSSGPTVSAAVISGLGVLVDGEGVHRLLAHQRRASAASKLWKWSEARWRSKAALVGVDLVEEDLAAHAPLAGEQHVEAQAAGLERDRMARILCDQAMELSAGAVLQLEGDGDGEGVRLQSRLPLFRRWLPTVVTGRLRGNASSAPPAPARPRGARPRRGRRRRPARRCCRLSSPRVSAGTPRCRQSRKCAAGADRAFLADVPGMRWSRTAAARRCRSSLASPSLVTVMLAAGGRR